MTATIEQKVGVVDLMQLVNQLGGTLVVEGFDKTAFMTFCAIYPELLLERDKDGKMIFMSPVFGGSGFRESLLNFYVQQWCKAYGKGQVGSPSIGFDLPNGATRSPDACWISEEKMATLTPENIEKSFLPIVPDFVVELRSDSDAVKKLKDKIQEEWIGQGVSLAWLIDPYNEKAYIYRADGSESIIDNFDGMLSGEAVLPGFKLQLSEFRLAGK